MEASASTKTKKASTLSSAALGSDNKACGAAGAPSSVSEPVLAKFLKIMRSLARAATSQTGPSTDFVDRLPAALAQRIFLLLPMHDRMRCREVSRAWRAALADGGCWRVFRFSGCQDLPRIRDDPDRLGIFILAAGRAAGGAAEEIDARGLQCADGEFHEGLKELAEENGGSLRVLRITGTSCYIGAEKLDAESSVASWLKPGKLPHLEELEADVITVSIGAARQLLDDARQPGGRSKALRISTLYISADGVSFINGEFETPEKQRRVAESLADFLRTALPGHPSLTGLKLSNMPLFYPGLMDAVADAAVACGLESLRLEGPHINHTCLPALSRALRAGRLRSLELFNGFFSAGSAPTLDGPRGAHEEFCAALRGSRLESLTLRGMRLWAEPNNGSALLAALTAHPTLQCLNISWNRAWEAASKAAAAESVAALLEANAPALKSLDIEHCTLAAEHLERILVALRGNTHLAALDCEQYDNARGMDKAAFAERVVLPLVRANTTLRTLVWDSDWCGAVGEEIDRIIEARADGSPPVTL